MSPDKVDTNPMEPLLEMLPLFESGNVTVTVNNFPLVKADAKSKSLDVEIRGVKELGLNLRTLVKIQGKSQGILESLKGSESMARELNEKGWKLSIYESGNGLLTMGRGVSPLTGYIRANPLKLWRVLNAL